MDGIIDKLKVIHSMVYKNRFMPNIDDEGNLIQSKEQFGLFVKRIKKRVEDGEILRYSMHKQITVLACYKDFDEFINKHREKEVDRLNETYYGKEKYLKLKQCI